MKSIKRSVGQRLVSVGTAMVQSAGPSPNKQKLITAADPAAAADDDPTSLTVTAAGDAATTRNGNNDDDDQLPTPLAAAELSHPTAAAAEDTATNLYLHVTAAKAAAEDHLAMANSASALATKLIGAKDDLLTTAADSSGAIEAVTVIKDFCKTLTAGIPGASQLVTCIELILDREAAFRESHARADALYDTVVFVLESTANCYDPASWQVGSKPVKWVLKNLDDAVRGALAVFETFAGRGFWGKLLFAQQTVAQVKECEEALKEAMDYLQFLMVVDVRMHAAEGPKVLSKRKRPARPEVMELTGDEINAQKVVDSTPGGLATIQSNPALLRQGMRSDDADHDNTEWTDADYQDLQLDFTTSVNDMRREITRILESQGKTLDEVKSELMRLAERGSMFTRVKCNAIRHVWMRAGWGARVKVAEVVEVVSEEIWAELEAEIKRLTGTRKRVGADGQLEDEDEEYVGEHEAAAPSKVQVMAEVKRRMDHFLRVFKASIDADGSGMVSPTEVNHFFHKREWSLLDFFKYVALFFPTVEYHLLSSIEALFTQLVSTLTSTAASAKRPFHTFFHVSRSLFESMQLQAGSERLAMDWTRFHIVMQPLHDHSAFLAKLSPASGSNSWSWSKSTRYHTLPALRALHRIHDAIAPIRGAVESSSCDWQSQLAPAVNHLLDAIRDWSPGPAASLHELMQSANVWYAAQAFWTVAPDAATGSVHFQRLHMLLPSSSTHPLPGTAWYPHVPELEIGLPDCAVVGGRIAGKPVYLAQCGIAVDEKVMGVARMMACAYAYDAQDAGLEDGFTKTVAPGVGQIGLAAKFDWMVYERVHGQSSTVGEPVPRWARWQRFKLGWVPSPHAAMMGHHDSTPTTWFGRLRIPNGDVSIYSSLPAHSSAPATSPDTRIDPNDSSLYDCDASNTADDLVPGMIFMHSGTCQLEFLATRVEPNGSTTTLCTLPPDQNPVIGACDTYMHLPRDSIDLSHLVLWRHQQLSMFYQEMDWLPLAAEGPTPDMEKFHVPIVTCGTPSIAGHLAWCLDATGDAGGGVRLGMCFPSIARNVAFYCRRTEDREEWVAADKFLVLMNKFDPNAWSRFGSSLNKPLRRLFWFPSPDLTGKETADGAVLKLVELYVGGSRTRPVTRRLEKGVVTAFPDLGQGAFTITNTVTAAASVPAPRTEYLYYVITTLSKIDWYTPYLDGAMDDASTRGDLAALNWWLDSGLVLDYTEDAVTNASISGHVHVLQWWYDHKDRLKFKYKDHAVDVSMHVDVLGWWRDNLAAGGIKYMEEAVGNASGFGKLDVLDWWLSESGLEFKYDASAVDFVGTSMHMGPDRQVQVLEWWKDAHVAGKLPRGMEYTEKAMDCAKSTQVLDWWIEKAAEASLPLKYSPAALVTLDVDKLKWWKQRSDEGKIELRFVPSERNLEQVFRASKEAMGWWVDSGLLDEEVMQRLVMACMM